MKKYLKARFITKLRNLLNIKPVHISIDNVPDNSPISDFFPWRNDENSKHISVLQILEDYQHKFKVMMLKFIYSID